jgi:aldehyde:ferredoxin oxidoreductase
MTAGYTGKILRVDLTKRSTAVLDTARYEEYGGGNGIASVLFWELCRDKAISGFDPGNVVILMSGPLTGTLAPGAGRMEVCGINVYSYPVEWFSRSNIGGFFSTMLKYAGWDGVVIEGRADQPVWVNIINDKVTIEDAKGLWGRVTITTQKEIWQRVTGKTGFGQWMNFNTAQTTQGPSILCIGPGGESLSRLGTLQTGIGMAAGQGGFGGVWGAKNLKAISVIGTGSIKVANPRALIAARNWVEPQSPRRFERVLTKPEGSRVTSCAGCFLNCKTRVESGVQNDGQCVGIQYVTDVPIGGKSGADTVQTCGLNLYEMAALDNTEGVYLRKLHEAGVLGPGKIIDSAPLPMEKWGSAAFAEALCHAIVNRQGIGADLAEGLMRAAKKWGRLAQDLESGLLHKPQWGYGWHWNLPFVEQGYGSLVGDRDITEHALCSQRVEAQMRSAQYNAQPTQKIVEMLSKKLIPYNDDPFMLDYSWQQPDGSNMKQALATGIYSGHRAKFVAWHRHYTRFWIESILYCDWMFPNWFNLSSPDLSGLTPEVETRFLQAVTGKNLSFAEGMETGRKIWNLNRAIWVLQGRHRDGENFAGFMYTPAGSAGQSGLNFVSPGDYKLPVYENGEWKTRVMDDMYFDKGGVEQWKTRYYQCEGWDTHTGWPTRKTLEELGLHNVADTLKSAGKLGGPD